MSTFAVRVRRITTPVTDHPNADRLSLVKIDDYVAITVKDENGSHRFSEGDYVVYVPEGAVLPEDVLKLYGYWDETKGRGLLDGSGGDRVKARKLRGVFSQGLVLPVARDNRSDDRDPNGMLTLPGVPYPKNFVNEGDDVAEVLGITKYEPPIPASMQGEVLHFGPGPVYFDVDSIQSMPDLFYDGERVIVSEKLHGTCVQFGLTRDHSNPELFGPAKNFFVTSKGIGKRGLVFKDNEANDGNIYVRALRQIEKSGGFERIDEVFSTASTVRFFGEIVGKGVQDLSYGMKDAKLFIFDVMVNDTYLPPEVAQSFVEEVGLTFVPILYTGAFSREIISKIRDGKDSLSNSHVREGVVIRAAHGNAHPILGRKVAKWVSPDYLTRSAKNATEYN